MMRKLSQAMVCLILVAGLTGTPLLGQVTTGTIAGTIRAESDGSVLPGVGVTAVHVPTGTEYRGWSGANGRYTIPNVRVGGPYTVTASLDGFRTEVNTGIQVGLGATAEVPISLEVAALAETIEVQAEADEVLNSNRTGSTSSVSEEQIESLPTVNRSLQDFARTNPYFRTLGFDESSTRLSVAGRNERYNNIQIDGAVNNDLFGLASTGTPGGQTNTQPISLDAIQQLQLLVSPYDVRQGGFTGGGINAVTRSGSNEVSGSVFGSVRSEDFVGDGPFDRPVANFDQEQYGGRVGGPILQDQLFYFLSGELNTREEPSGVSADSSAPTQFHLPEQAAQLRQFLTDEFGYDPGTLGDFPAATDSDLFFGRLDWNLGSSNQLTLRHNYVDATRDVVSNRSRFSFRFPTAIYTIADETNSTVAQVNSVFTTSVFNEARIGFQTIRDVRDVPVIFPSVEIGGTGPRRGDLHVGTERFSGANSLDQDVLQITDDLTFLVGDHTIVVGTHNELFEFKNLFLSDFYGYYYFPTLDDFFAGEASEFRISFARGDDPRRATQFDVAQYGLYASDQWRVNPNLTLTFGLRGDMPSFGDVPTDNPLVVQELGLRTSNTPSEDVVWSPRVGFNWNPTGNNNQQLRGGIGVFAGRTPYVWISNVYGNTGVESVALSCFGSCDPPAFNPDPLAQPRNLGAAGTVSVDLMDPDFEFPRVLRATLGYDTVLPFGFRGTLEGLWSQTMEDVYYINANREQTGVSALDGRPTYSTISRDIRDAVMITNTDEGESISGTLQLIRPFSNGFTFSSSYTYQDAESAFEGGSSRAISNWQFHPTQGDIFNPQLSTSSYEIEHRFVLSTSYAFETGPLAHTLGLYYNAQTGQPYSLLMSGDPNRDQYRSNDLLYVPASENEIILQNRSRQVIPYSEFANFLRSVGIDPTAGRILERNELQQPWWRQLDFHYELGLPLFGDVATRITFDVLNLTNLIDEESGVTEYVSFGTYTPIFFAGTDSETGKPIYRENFNGALDPGSQFSTSDLGSRWQARLGLRVNF